MPQSNDEYRAAESREVLWQAYRRRRGGYPMRSRHRDAEGEPRYVNRLILELSPYLLQHAHNPVDWWPWGEPAFARARADNKPLLLSIGYSSCHWCHVMEEESFDDMEVATCLNRHFIAIKLDREMLPDVDSYYMNAAMLFTGHGGWPLNCLLTEQRRPFFAGTYFPKDDFLRLLNGVSAYWQQGADTLREQARQVTERLEQPRAASAASTTVSDHCLAHAVAQLAEDHDQEHGGFGRAPKFPQEANLLLLLEQALAEQDARALGMAEHSLQKMAEGGIHDHIGGGFHRYATDRQWRVPHFEKMLYNQANLARAYLRAWQLTGKDEYHTVVCACLDYVLRELRAPEHGFHSATDADSEGEEGAFFTWTDTQLRAALGSGRDYALARDFFSIHTPGHFAGTNVPHTPMSCLRMAQTQGLTPGRLGDTLKTLREKMRQARARRPAPLRDDKIITAWNGMMITALSAAGRLLQRPDYSQAAEQAGHFLLHGHRQDNGQLWRISLHGNQAVAGQQDDYAALIEACVQLYDDTGQASWLAAAEQLSEHMLSLFHDVQQGDFFMREVEDQNGEAPPGRVKDLEDHAVPAGNSMALRALGRLARRSSRRDYPRLARRLADSMAGRLAKWPHACCYALLGLSELHRGEQEAVQYASGVCARLDASATDDCALHLHIASGWRVEASARARQRMLRLAPEGELLQGLRLPDGASWSAQVTIRFTLRRTGAGPWPRRLLLCLVPCRADACLPEETLTLLVPPGGGA